MTRRGFLGTMAAAGVCSAGKAGEERVPFDKAVYEPLRKQLRAFYSRGGNGDCTDPAVAAAYQAIKKDVDAWVKAHPGFDALDVRRECYRAMARHFAPVLFTESPFYCEAGVNGGWGGMRPARLVNAICGRFYSEQGLIPKAAFELMWKRNAERFSLCCGPFVDDIHHLPPFRTIFEKGFGGVRAETAAALAACPAGDTHGRKQLETALAGLDALREMQLAFARKAEEMLKAPGLDARAVRFLTRIADCAKRCPWEAPKTFYEGLNTLWFLREMLGYTDGLACFTLGRPDAWLIGFYRADLAAGRLTEAEARDLIARFLILADCHYDGDAPVRFGTNDHEIEIPVTAGGCDAAGRPVYNEITRAMLDAHLELDLVYPKMHCRVSAASPGDYLRHIGRCLMKGHAVFGLFNDDRMIPQFEAVGFARERARDYTCSGCWNGNIDSATEVDDANYMSVMRVFELTVHRDPKVEAAARIRIDPIDGARTYEEVRDTVYHNFIRFFRATLAEYTRWGRQNAKVFPHPVYSVCLEGGTASRRDVTEGGVRFCPRIVTLAFLANVVDSLLAVRKLCFVDRTCTLAELLAAVRANWKGPDGARLRAAALKANYWGDNSAASNGLMRWWIDSVARDIDGFTNDRGGPYVLATWIYREFHYWGKRTKASPDGRFDGDRLAQGFSPSEYRCESGVTDVFNAIGSLDHSKLFASNANLSFERTAMSPEIFEAVFRVAAKKDMHLLQPNCFSVADLLDAQAHPERHRDLIVRVCGFSARFVSLSREWQDEVIARHRLK